MPYTQNFTFTGGVQPYTYTVVGSLPDCLKLNSSSSSTTGTILGTPCGSGTSQFTIKVTDSGGAAPISQDFIITIAPAPTLSVIVAPLPVGTLGSSIQRPDLDQRRRSPAHVDRRGRFASRTLVEFEHGPDHGHTHQRVAGGYIPGDL